MKTLSTTLLFLLICTQVTAQEMKLQNLKEVQIDSVALSEIRCDLNGNVAAIITLSFSHPIQNPSFKGNIIDQVAVDERTVILYVADRTKRITIQHENYYTLVLDIKSLGLIIEGGHSYLALISNDFAEDDGAVDYENSQILEFYSDIRLKSLIVNGQEWDVVNVQESYFPDHRYNYRRWLPFGVYRYEAESVTGLKLGGEATVKSRIAGKRVELLFR